MGQFDKPSQAPKNAQDIMGDMMPKTVALKKMKQGREVTDESIKEDSKGYPKAPKSGDVFNLCKKAAKDKFNKGEKWVPGVKVEHKEWKAVGQTEMEGNEFILITGNKPNEYHFFKGPKLKKTMKATPAEDYADSSMNGSKELKDIALTKKLGKKLKSKLNRDMGRGHPRTCMYKTSELVAANIVKKGEVRANVIFAIEDPNLNKKIRIFTGKSMKT